MTKLIVLFAVLCIIVFALVLWRFDSFEFLGLTQKLLDSPGDGLVQFGIGKS